MFSNNTKKLITDGQVLHICAYIYLFLFCLIFVISVNYWGEGGYLFGEWSFLRDLKAFFVRVKIMPERFVDLRTIPLPDDIVGVLDIREIYKKFNYPQIWIYIIGFLSWFGSPYLILGWLQFTVFLVLSTVMIYRIGHPIDKILFVMMVCSTVTMLLLERGNNDGWVFLIMLMATLVPARLSGFLGGLAAGLKLFPLAGIPMILLRGRLKALMGYIISMPFVIWALIDLRAIHKATPRPSRSGMGIRSFAKHLHQQYPTLSWDVMELTVLLSAIFLIMIGLSWWLFAKNYKKLAKRIAKNERHLNIILIFGMLFMGIYVVTYSYPYRIIFYLPIAYLIVIYCRQMRFQSIFFYGLGLINFMVFFAPYLGRNVARSTKMLSWAVILFVPLFVYCFREWILCYAISSNSQSKIHKKIRRIANFLN